MPGRKSLDERALLLLGVLKTQASHGYLINDFIERNLSRVTNMKKPTGYALLERLCDEGLVTATDEEGGRRPRRVYAISPAGNEAFEQLLREVLSVPDAPHSTLDIGLMFLDHLPSDEAISLLERRLVRVKELLAAYQAAPSHGFGVGVDLANGHAVALLAADRDWLIGTLDHLRGPFSPQA